MMDVMVLLLSCPASAHYVEDNRGGTHGSGPSSSADDMCDDIQREIDERWQFLAEMQAVGGGRGGGGWGGVVHSRFN